VAFHKNLVIGYQILPKNTNINIEDYVNFLNDSIHPAVRKLRIRSPIILHDNAPPHKHQNVKDLFN
jgi:hypothetical protein